MLPSIVILDPYLTTALPPHLTAFTGMDALAHCLEAYCSPGYHPMADGIAFEGMRIINKWLIKAVKNGNDLERKYKLFGKSSHDWDAKMCVSFSNDGFTTYS